MINDPFDKNASDTEFSAFNQASIVSAAVKHHYVLVTMGQQSQQNNGSVKQGMINASKCKKKH
jgi:hypothetical protein